MNEDEDIPLSEDPKEADFELMFEEIYNIILNNAKKDGPVLDTVANMLRAGEIAVSEDVVKAFKARFTQLGGRIVDEQSYQSLGSTSQQNLVTKLNSDKADVIVTATAGSFGALPQIISGLRTLGNDTPVLNSWAGDGTYWVTNSLLNKLSNETMLAIARGLRPLGEGR